MNGRKRGGKAADIVFLMDATRGMAGCIQTVKTCLPSFFEELTDRTATDYPTVGDWRAKVVGFRDFETDGADGWFADNPFTRDLAELQRQFDALEARGGGERDDSLLDAIYAVVSASKSKRGTEDLGMWRDCHDAARTLVVFADAPCKPAMVAPACRGGNVDVIGRTCAREKVALTLVAPSSNAGDCTCFEELSWIERSVYVEIPHDPSCSASPLNRFLDESRADLWIAVRELAQECQRNILRHWAGLAYMDDAGD